MINSISVPMQELGKDANAIFKTNQVITKSSRNPYVGWMDYSQSNGVFTITRPGIYRIHYNANVTASDKLAARLAIMANDKVLEGSQTETFISEPTLYQALSATTLVRVTVNNVLPISLTNISEDKIEIKEASIIIDRVA